jgi:hypothetical protein
MTLIAFLFLQHLRLRAARREKKDAGNRHRTRACRPSGACCLIIWRTRCTCDVHSVGLASPLAH